MLAQTGMGVFLKLHVMDGSVTRRAVVKAHSWVGKSFPVFGWGMAVFGVIAMNGFCFGEHVTQCAAHGILGSGFVAYAIILLVLMRVGTKWLARRKVSQEFIDSSTILVLGIINTFTEVRDEPSKLNDLPQAGSGASADILAGFCVAF